MMFKDNFSKQSDTYLKYRPHYPDKLYEHLYEVCAKNELAWDCGTGNGQAAFGLARHFTKIIASDPSEQQIKNAIPLKNVSYKVAAAEQSGLENESVDLISIANALHWFDQTKFFEEAQRVLKPCGILAAWCYGNPKHSSEIDNIIDHLHDDILGSYWLAENRLVEKGYSTIDFPFQELKSPDIKMEKELAFDDLLGVLNSWSATQRYKDKNGSDPVSLIKKDLENVWPDKMQAKLFYWELVVKLRKK